MKWTHCCLLSFCRYSTVQNCWVFSVWLHWTEHIYCEASLPLLNSTLFSQWSVCLYWILHIVFVMVSLYLTVQIAVCCLSVGTELYIMLSVVPLSVLNFTYCCAWSEFRYWTVHIAVSGLIFATEFKILQCVFCLSVLKCKHCCMWSVCVYWIVHIAVCCMNLCTELYTLEFVVCLSLINC